MTDPNGTEMQTLEAHWNYVMSKMYVSQRSMLRLAKPSKIDATTVLVEVSSQFAADRFDKQVRTNVEDLLSECYGHEIHVNVAVNSDLTSGDMVTLPPSANVHDEPDENAPLAEVTQLRPQVSEEESVVLGRDLANTIPATTLNAKYTFDTFVCGSSNRFAHAAANAAAESPGNSFNPLMIYGPSGLGKTHLLHAIGHYVNEYYSDLRVRYVSTEELTNDFINAIAESRMVEFRQKYREVDVLLIDDVQFLESKIQTQEEFFHTFNTLHNADKQIVMTSDRPPKLLEALEPRLRSRFEWGLITDVHPPDLETRIAILRRKVAADRLTADLDVLEFIASRIPTNIRELEGALIRVTAFASLNGRKVDVALAKEVLKDLVPTDDDVRVLPQTILEVVVDSFDVTLEQLQSPQRSKHLTQARQIAMYLCRDLTDLSLPKIGDIFDRDHSTVLHSLRRVKDLMSSTRSVYDKVTDATNRIKAMSNEKTTL